MDVEADPVPEPVPEVLGVAGRIDDLARDGIDLATWLLPFGAAHIDRLEAIYEELPGWTDSTFGIRELDRLPPQARPPRTRACARKT